MGPLEVTVAPPAAVATPEVTPTNGAPQKTGA